jgi:methionyl-tRNA formyltransferase
MPCPCILFMIQWQGSGSDFNMRIVFMGTPEFSAPALEYLVKSEYRVVVVYTQPDRQTGRGQTLEQSPVKKLALKHSLEVFQPVKLRNSEEMQRLAALEPDLILVSAFGQILPQSILDIPRFGCLNVHPSLLPKYRGATPIPSAILGGDKETGVTIMLMDTGMDTGPIVSQIIVGIEPQDTTESLSNRLAQAGVRLLAETLPLWFDRSLKPQPQDGNKATYTAPITKEDGVINWQMTAEEISRRVRAFYPWPGCYTWWQGKLLKILEAVALHKERNLSPGKVIALASGQPAVVGVETGDGILGLIRIQLEGKRALTAAEFLLGQRTFAGSTLGSKS